MGRRPSSEARCVLSELNEQGIAVSVFSSLGIDERLFKSLQEECLLLAESPEGKNSEVKPYLYELLGAGPIILAADSNFVRLAIHPTILSVAASYYGNFPRVNSLNTWLNVPSGAEAVRSQLWHRDPGDQFVLKMFIFLADVDADNGPFSYIPGSHWRGPRARLAVPFTHDGTSPRTTDEQMRQVVPEEDWKTVMGKAGTVIFADTRGYHKGGHVLRDRRIMLSVEYARPTFEYPALVKVDTRGMVLTREQRWALE